MEQIFNEMEELIKKFSEDSDELIKKLKEKEDYKEEGTCSICFRKYTHWGNNAYPVNRGRCCDECNANIVVPARIQQMVNKKGDK